MESTTRYAYSLILWAATLTLPIAFYYHISGNYVITSILWFISGVYGFRLNDAMQFIGVGIPLGLPIIIGAVILQFYLHGSVQRKTTGRILYISTICGILISFLHPVFGSYLLKIPIPIASLLQVLVHHRIDDP